MFCFALFYFIGVTVRVVVFGDILFYFILYYCFGVTDRVVVFSGLFLQHHPWSKCRLIFTPCGVCQNLHGVRF